ncbi:Ctr copper transporter family-domain-containing protein [Tricladium varicosporioides]|nr:Ctr copper transporter family-domain-containing protein [Hymenoscyphus varicosporioides]
MNMGTSTMASMAGMATSTTTGSVASATTSMAGMSMGGSCKISMLWNWYTIDACFIARSWHITSKGMFAGSCIGVILLVMSLEFLRRSAKEYDRYIIRQYQRAQPLQTTPPITPSKAASNGSDNGAPACEGGSQNVQVPFRPNIFQQMIRATFHMMQFTVAYFVMLLAMYYNGYIIICIIIGAWLGAFAFSWETINMSSGPQEEATMCCG